MGHKVTIITPSKPEWNRYGQPDILRIIPLYSGGYSNTTSCHLSITTDGHATSGKECLYKNLNRLYIIDFLEGLRF
ncbi:MAG: hypothetical protein LBL90_00175 [Prevotellaceae bacterium]|nr:hypothetical protein [Prevotellaceae bacterium]